MQSRIEGVADEHAGVIGCQNQHKAGQEQERHRADESKQERFGRRNRQRETPDAVAFGVAAHIDASRENEEKERGPADECSHVLPAVGDAVCRPDCGGLPFCLFSGRMGLEHVLSGMPCIRQGTEAEINGQSGIEKEKSPDSLPPVLCPIHAEQGGEASAVEKLR